MRLRHPILAWMRDKPFAVRLRKGAAWTYLEWDGVSFAPSRSRRYPQCDPSPAHLDYISTMKLLTTSERKCAAELIKINQKIIYKAQ